MNQLSINSRAKHIPADAVALLKRPAMEKKASVFLVIILGTVCSFLLVPSSNAIPLSRVQRLLPLQEAGEMPSVEESTPKQEVVQIWSSITPQDDMTMNARMALETQDYPPSGPNNHHKPPGWS